MAIDFEHRLLGIDRVVGLQVAAVHMVAAAGTGGQGHGEKKEEAVTQCYTHFKFN